MISLWPLGTVSWECPPPLSDGPFKLPALGPAPPSPNMPKRKAEFTHGHPHDARMAARLGRIIYSKQVHHLGSARAPGNAGYSAFQHKKRRNNFPPEIIDFLYQVGESAYKYVANAIPAGMLHATYSTIIHDLDFLDYGGEPKESKKANHFACHFAAATQKSLYNDFAAIANKLSWGKCEPNELVSHNYPAGVDSDDSDMPDLRDLSSSESESDSENESKPKVSPGKRGTKAVLA